MANVAEVHVMSEPRSEHLTAMEVASYVDGVVSAEVRRRLEAHLADCLECRDEIVEAGRIARAQTAGRRSSARFWVPVAMAAALVLILVRPVPESQRGEHREAPVTTTVFPQAIAPRGTVDDLPTLTWTSVPNAARYQVRLFNADAVVLWDHSTTDTSALVPDSVVIRPRATYQWEVKAQTGFGRSVPSDLTAFSVRYPRRR